MAFEDFSNVGQTSLDSALKNAKSVALSLGKSALHTLAPDNFEYYMCSFELLDGEGNTSGFMFFNIMPDNIVETIKPIKTITKTSSGISTLFSNTFAPIDISIQGTFGRKLRLILGMKETVDKSDFFNGNLGINIGQTNVLIKTGYGLIKMLESIVKKSDEVDKNGKPYVLIFNNYAFNKHYVVEIMQSAFSQSSENNMIWFYSLEMKAVAPASAVKIQDDKSNTKFIVSVANNAIAKGLTNIITDVLKSTSGSTNIGL